MTPNIGQPICIENKKCYYGECLHSNIDKCECPLCHDNDIGVKDGGLVCGSNSQSYENHCVLTRDACKQLEPFKKKYDGKCSKCSQQTYKLNEFSDIVGFLYLRIILQFVLCSRVIRIVGEPTVL